MKLENLYSKYQAVYPFIQKKGKFPLTPTGFFPALDDKKAAIRATINGNVL